MKLAFNSLFGEFVSNIGNTLTFTGYGLVEEGEDWLELPRETDTTLTGGIYLAAEIDRSSSFPIPAVLITADEDEVVKLSAGNNLLTIQFPDKVDNYEFKIQNIESTLVNPDNIVREGFGSDPGKSIFTADKTSEKELITTDSYKRAIVAETSEGKTGLNGYGENVEGRTILRVYTDIEIDVPGMVEESGKTGSTD